MRDAVQVEAVEPLELKGKQERVPAYRLVSVSGGEGNVRRHDSPIVGREEELKAIDQALHEVSETGSARLITLIGDAGIGKSRLAREVIARAGASARVVRGRCLAYGDGITFWPLREMVSEAADIHFEDAPEEARAKLAALLPDADVAARIASGDRPQRGCLPDARDFVGGAQVLRVARRRTVRRSRSSTTSIGPSRRSST